jgi:hypothetical protein
MQVARAVILVGILASGDAMAKPVVGAICDTPDRIFVVDVHVHGRTVVGPLVSTTPLAGTVTVIARATGKRREAPIAKGSVLTDDCGGVGGGHAGCSERGGSTIKSRVLGKDELFFGDDRRNLLVHGDTYSECRDAEVDPWIALCSTRSWFAVVGKGHDHDFLRIYDKDDYFEEAVTTEADGAYAGARAKVVIGTRTANVELDGTREACLAVYQPLR